MEFNHQHLILSANGLKNPPRTKEAIEEWLLSVVEAIDMKLLMGPYATRCDTEGNEGVTGIAVIETSHISAHCWDTVAEPFMKVDVYSCKDFTPYDVLITLKRFKPDNVDYILVDRNNSSMEITDNWRNLKL